MKQNQIYRDDKLSLEILKTKGDPLRFSVAPTPGKYPSPIFYNVSNVINHVEFELHSKLPPESAAPAALPVSRQEPSLRRQGGGGGGEGEGEYL